MKILALEFSSQRRSVAVGERNSEFRVLGSATEDNPRGSNGMVLIDRALHEAQIVPAEIGILAIGLGPGSYAGIRSAIAISQGWQLAGGTRLLGISSIEIIAEEARQAGHFGEITIVSDAQRNEAYAARYHIAKSKIESLAPVCIVPLNSLKAVETVGPNASHLVPNATDIYPTAATLARYSESRSDFRAGEELVPIYLRETSFVKALNRGT